MKVHVEGKERRRTKRGRGVALVPEARIPVMVDHCIEVVEVRVVLGIPWPLQAADLRGGG